MSFLGSERLYMRMVSMLYAYVVRLSGMSGCPVLSGTDLPSARPPNVRLTCAAGSLIDGTMRRHATRMKNAPGFGPRQRRQVQGVLGGRADTFSLFLLLQSALTSYRVNYFVCTSP